MNKVVQLMALVVGLSLALPARADRTRHLIQMLEKPGTSYKVRLQVIALLGQFKERAAVPALIKALGHRSRQVRRVAIAALVLIGDRRALPALKKLSHDRKSKLVADARRAVAKLSAPPAPAAAGERWYFTVAAIANRSEQTGRQLPALLRRALLGELNRIEGITTTWPGGKRPTRTELAERDLDGYVIDGAIVALSRRRTHAGHRFRCEIRVSVATFPGNSMKAFYRGEGLTTVAPEAYSPRIKRKVFLEVLGEAARQATGKIATRFLRLRTPRKRP